MDAKEYLKGVAKLQALHRNLPDYDPDEDFVTDYHEILKALERETGEELVSAFAIPSNRLERQISSYTPASRRNRAGPTVTYRSKRTCNRNFFLSRLEAAIDYLSSLVPARERETV